MSPVTPDMILVGGTLPRYTSIGCYSLAYLDGDRVLCAVCARAEMHRPLMVGTYDEGAPLECEGGHDGCHGEIESSYGEVES